MLSYYKVEDPIDEAKDQRLQQRVTPSHKREIQFAASLLGLEDSQFMVSSALEKAREVIEQHTRRHLSERDCRALVEAMDAPVEPVPPALREAAELSRKKMVRADN